MASRFVVEDRAVQTSFWLGGGVYSKIWALFHSRAPSKLSFRKPKIFPDNGFLQILQFQHYLFFGPTHTHPGGTALVEDNAIEELKSSSENLNTRKSTNLLVGVFRNWQAGQGQDMETYEVEELNKFTINL